MSRPTLDLPLKIVVLNLANLKISEENHYSVLRTLEGTYIHKVETGTNQVETAWNLYRQALNRSMRHENSEGCLENTRIGLYNPTNNLLSLSHAGEIHTFWLNPGPEKDQETLTLTMLKDQYVVFFNGKNTHTIENPLEHVRHNLENNLKVHSH